jgi:hypothetical protein
VTGYNLLTVNVGESLREDWNEDKDCIWKEDSRGVLWQAKFRCGGQLMITIGAARSVSGTGRVGIEEGHHMRREDIALCRKVEVSLINKIHC